MRRDSFEKYTAAPEYTDHEAREKTTQELIRSRCIFETQLDGTTIGLTGGARELLRRSEIYDNQRGEKP